MHQSTTRPGKLHVDRGDTVIVNGVQGTVTNLRHQQEAPVKGTLVTVLMPYNPMEQEPQSFVKRYVSARALEAVKAPNGEWVPLNQPSA